MSEIPKPELLDPDRVDRDDRENLTAEDHRSQAQLLAKALGESCAYAYQLWEQLNAVRGYLLDSLPPDPTLPGPHTVACAAPTGPDDESGWQDWITAFATTTSTLCGAHGDSGFGLSRAREEAQKRRSAPELQVRARLQEPSGKDEGDGGVDRGYRNPKPGDAAPPSPVRPEAGTGDVTAPAGAQWTPVKVAASAVVGVLALRGLRPPRRRVAS